MENITINAANISQLKEILALSQSTFDIHQKQLPERFYDTREQHRKILIRSTLEGQSTTCFLMSATSEGQLIGYVHCNLKPTKTGYDSHDIVGTIIDISVHSDFHNQGVGLALVKAGEEQMIKKGATQLAANVWQGNVGSYRLFEKAGFEVYMTEFGKRIASPKTSPLANNKYLSWREQIPAIVAVVLLVLLITYLLIT